MFELVQQIRGLHPGIYLERELKRRGIAKGKFALSIQEYPQTLVSVMKGKRRMNPSLALRSERALGMEEGTLLLLQAMFDLEDERRQVVVPRQPNLARIRPALFWDVDILKLNWELNYKTVIRRIQERGNRTEQDEIRQFYGEALVNQVMRS